MTDVVVIGAGSAGAVVAARLSERSGRRVTLLEAGPDHDSAHTPPSIAGASFVEAMREPGRVWDPLDAVRADAQTPRRYTRGRGTGGSSAVNAMVALPGEPDDYDEWARIHGLRSWGWEHVRPWFDRVAVPAAPAPTFGAVSAAVMAAGGEAARLTRFPDGRRASVNDVYLEPVRARPNLVIRGDAEVRRVVIQGRRVIGVELADGSTIDTNAVVVCAGAIHSPRILLRSGVDLEGVGQGLQDHPSFPVTIRLREEHWLQPGVPAVSSLLRATYRRRHDLQVLPLDEADPTLPGLGVLLGAVMKVASRGVVTADAIEFRMLSDERDVAAMHAVADVVERLLEHPVVAALGDVLEFDRSDEGLLASVGDYVHAVGTCRMGHDEGAVVDEWCCVHHHEGLWVCDASVMPEVPRANTHLPTLMIAERVAAHLDTLIATGA